MVAAVFLSLMFAFLTEDCNHQKSNVGNRANGEAQIKMDGLKTGVWGGQHISLDVTEQGATVEYDCAHGSIDGKIIPDASGNFNVAGTHVRDHGGPVRKDEIEDAHPARFSGQIRNDTMTLTVTESDTNESVGTFTLVHGASPRIMKCK